MAHKEGVPIAEKTRNNGTWTQARFNSFIKSLLRKGTQRWSPKNLCLKTARMSKGNYLCNGCQEIVPVTVVKGGKRVKNVHVDHILPVVDPAVGFTTWDDCIERMFCEVEGFQVLCSGCHSAKTSEERQVATERRRNEKRTG